MSRPARIEQGEAEADLDLRKPGDSGRAEWLVGATEHGVWPASVRIGGEWRTLPLAVPPQSFAPAGDGGCIGENDAYLVDETSAILCAGFGFFLYARLGDAWSLAGSGDFGLGAVSERKRGNSAPPILKATWSLLQGAVSARFHGRAGLELSVATREGDFEVDVRITDDD